MEFVSNRWVQCPRIMSVPVFNLIRILSECGILGGVIENVTLIFVPVWPLLSLLYVDMKCASSVLLELSCVKQALRNMRLRATLGLTIFSRLFFHTRGQY